MLQTAWGSLFKSLRLARGDRLLIRGGTTSVGLAAAAIAKKHGALVVSTTRRADRDKLLRDHGSDEVLVDQGSIAEQVNERFPGGFDKILKLIGTVTFADSIKCLKLHGTMYMAGIVGGRWTFDSFTPSLAIPTARFLTTYGGTAEDFMATPLESLVKDMADGSMHVAVGKVFRMEDIAEAHRCMEANEAGGKIVVLT